ncbi:MAG: hypothetical protein FJ010_11895 [Chloroflexi bacterium]|nr:hypothetical protein [Chloroflexota bacterium]
MIKRKKFDGVIETVHYTPYGKIAWVRAYERKGFVFTDWLKLDRESLIERLKNRKRFYVGQRKPLLGNEFDLAAAVQLEGEDGSEIIFAGEAKAGQDYLEGAPIY